MSLRFDKYFHGWTGARGIIPRNPAASTLDAFIRQAAALLTCSVRKPENAAGGGLIAGHRGKESCTRLLVDEPESRAAAHPAGMRAG